MIIFYIISGADGLLALICYKNTISTSKCIYTLQPCHYWIAGFSDSTALGTKHKIPWNAKYYTGTKAALSYIVLVDTDTMWISYSQLCVIMYLISSSDGTILHADVLPIDKNRLKDKLSIISYICTGINDMTTSGHAICTEWFTKVFFLMQRYALGDYVSMVEEIPFSLYGSLTP